MSASFVKARSGFDKCSGAVQNCPVMNQKDKDSYKMKDSVI